MNLAELTIQDLLGLQVDAIEELRARGVLRTSNSPVGDYTEWLVARALGLKLVANSKAGYDAISPEHVKFQIKGRRVTAKNPSRQLSAIRNLAGKDFDVLVAVIFDERYQVIEAVSVPHAAVGDYAVYREHVNAHILYVRGNLLTDSRVESLLKQLDGVGRI